MKINKSWLPSMLGEVCAIHDSDRKPINSRERKRRKAKCRVLYPYYGATGQVDSIDNYIFEGEYVLLGEDGAPFLDLFKNKAYLVNGKFWVNNHAHILTGVNNVLDNNFLCYYLNQFNYSEFVTGTTRLKLTQARLKNIPICLPTLSEQKRIVAKIESLFSRLDSAKDSLERVRQEIKRYRQSVLKSAFEGKLTESWRKLKNIPASVERKIFRDVIEKISVNGKKIKQKDYVNQGLYPVIDQGQEFIGGYTNDKGSCVSVNRPVIIFGDHTRVIKLVNFDFAPGADGIKVFRPTPVYNVKYFRYMIDIVKLPDKGYARHYQYLENCEIPFVSLQEQNEVVKEIESRFDRVKVLEDTVQKGVERIEQLKQSILKKTFEGKLVEPDSNDEPVEVLLGRIKKEKSKLELGFKSKREKK